MNYQLNQTKHILVPESEVYAYNYGYTIFLDITKGYLKQQNTRHSSIPLNPNIEDTQILHKMSP